MPAPFFTSGPNHQHLQAGVNDCLAAGVRIEGDFCLWKGLFDDRKYLFGGQVEAGDIMRLRFFKFSRGAASDEAAISLRLA